MAIKHVIGAAVVRSRMRKIVRNVNAAVQQEMDDIADELLTASRDKAPQLHGTMTDPQHSRTDSKNARSQGRFTRRIKYTTIYAPIQHEKTFRPGPVTAAKLGNRVGIGKGFLSNPFKKAEPKIPRRISRAVNRAIRQSVR